MFIAIAGAYSERQWIKARLEAADVRQPRFRVIAEWLDSKDEDADLTDHQRTMWSLKLYEEIYKSDVLVYFPSHIPGLGCHREIGYALGVNRPVLLVGRRTNHPHDWHPGMTDCSTSDLQQTLEKMSLNVRPGSEEWKPVSGFEDLYEVSNYGRVRRLRMRFGGADRAYESPMMMKPAIYQNGYQYIMLHDKGFGRRYRVHRLVLETFVGPCPPGHDGAHLNGVRTDNGLWNLAWVSKINNQRHKELHGTKLLGTKNPKAKMTEEKVRQARRLFQDGQTKAAIARRFGVTFATMRALLNGETWKSV